jgi:murein L,D-transpeptidase YafK
MVVIVAVVKVRNLESAAEGRTGVPCVWNPSAVGKIGCMTDRSSNTRARRLRHTLILGAGVGLTACASQITLPSHLLPLRSDAIEELVSRRLRLEQPIFIRIFKEDSELEVWKQQDDGRYQHFRTYPICTWSGDLGPKIVEGDRQSPEGFYGVTAKHMNPHSKFHLSFNLGFPNEFDRSHGRTGTALMVHGKCTSAGCYAITDLYVEEVYALAREAFIGGQDNIPVHIFPFRMTPHNLTRHASSEHQPFWHMLKEGYDAFEATKQLPTVVVCGRRYVVNPIWRSPLAATLDASRPCPPHERDRGTLVAVDWATKSSPLGRILPGRKQRTPQAVPH